MLKYLTKKKNTFWYRRRINNTKEIVFSLKTKDYNEAVLRHSFINYQINYLFAQGIESMTDKEIKAIIDKYKTYMIEKSVNKFSRQRDEELGIYINGTFHGGHTKEALQVAIDKYQRVHMANDYDLVKAVTHKILNRSNIKEEFEKLTDEDDIYSFHYELLKAEWDLLYKAKIFQENLPNNKEVENTQIVKQTQSNTIINNSNDKEERYKLSELLKLYIDEKAVASNWSDKNVRDIYYVIDNLIFWYKDCYSDELKRQEFVSFRNDVIQKLPKFPLNPMFKDKNLDEVLEITQKPKIEKIGLTTINKHIGRVNQLFQWAEEAGYITKNYASNLRLKDERRTKQAKRLKDTYEEDDLKRLFHKSPWFTSEIKDKLRRTPEYVFIPLLSVYNGGAKPTELAQLHISDIKKYKGIWVIDFNNKEEKELKNDYYNSRRVPIAQKMIDIGFLDYVKEMKKRGYIKLFPTVKRYKSGGTSFTNKFSQYNRDYITKDEKKSFYSIKHLVNQELKNHKVPLYIINDITGHSFGSENKDIGTYGGQQMPEEIMKEEIDRCLTFDYIDLSNIKKAIKEIY